MFYAKFPPRSYIIYVIRNNQGAHMPKVTHTYIVIAHGKFSAPYNGLDKALAEWERLKNIYPRTPVTIKRFRI